MAPKSTTQPDWMAKAPEFVDAPEIEGTPADMPDRRSGALYDMSNELHLAVVVALITGRPLLLRGEPGSGKSSLAAYVARNLNWKYYEKVVTSATRAEDFLWTFDAVRRLGDAQALTENDPKPNLFDYVDPGVLWWALNPETAAERGADADHPVTQPAQEPFHDSINAERDDGHAVILIDELDKADPDVPNGLLVPLGSGVFQVAETGSVITKVETRKKSTRRPSKQLDLGHLLVVITTNEERQLPPAFLRRCVVYTIPAPKKPKLVAIAKLHNLGGKDAVGNGREEATFDRIADRLLEIRDELAEGERKPSVAEYLDAVRACLEFKVTPDAKSDLWKSIERVTMIKQPEDDADDT